MKPGIIRVQIRAFGCEVDIKLDWMFECIGTFQFVALRGLPVSMKRSRILGHCEQDGDIRPCRPIDLMPNFATPWS